MAMLMPTMAAAGGEQLQMPRPTQAQQAVQKTATSVKNGQDQATTENSASSKPDQFSLTQSSAVQSVQTEKPASSNQSMPVQSIGPPASRSSTKDMLDTDDAIVTSLTQSSRIIGTAPFDKNDAAGNDHDADKGCSRLLWSDRAQPACHSQ